ncbi:MAG: hypothetical protein RL701_6401 [Pseudomonadota bacterium]
MSDSSKAQVGFVGKTPARPDFVRQNVTDRIGAEFDRWLQNNMQVLQQGKAELPNGVRYMFSAPGCDSVAIGTLGRSQDQVGRAFPLAIYCSLPVADIGANFPAVPHASAEFLVAAEAILANVQTLSLDELRDSVLALTPPSAADVLASTQSLLDQIQRVPAGPLLAQLFSDDPNQSQAYGVHTLCTATAAVQKAPAAGPATVLDCPLGAVGEAGVYPWLELTRRRLAWSNPCPSSLWVLEPSPRLLIALGHASEQFLHFAAVPRLRATRLWPLVSERPDAIARAQALLPDLSAQPDQSTDTFWTALATFKP